MEEQIKEFERILNEVGETLTKLEKERKKLKKLKTKCWACGFEIKKSKQKITRHSIRGYHKPPYVYLCWDCHKKIEVWKRAIKILEKKEGLTIKKFKQVVKEIKKIK